MESKEIKKLLSDNYSDVEDYLERLPEFESTLKVDIKNLVSVVVNDYEDLFDELESQEYEVSSLEREISNLEDEISGLEDELENKDSEIEAMEEDVVIKPDNIWWQSLMEVLENNQHYINPQEVEEFIKDKGWVYK